VLFYDGSLVDITHRRQMEVEIQLQQNAAEIEALYQATLPLAHPPGDLVALGETIVATATREFNLVDCGLLVIDEERRELRRVARAGSYPMTATQPLLLDNERGLTVSAARVGHPVYAEDVNADPRYLAGVPETRSELAVPLIAGGRVVGVLDLQSPTPAAFGPRVQKLVTAFADQVALAVENALLFSETQPSHPPLEINHRP
jgi:sigma-B regulation protein RsbU (phosphoserine phosphatase)